MVKPRQLNPTSLIKSARSILRPPPPIYAKSGAVTVSKSEPRATAYNGDGSLATSGELPRKAGRSIDGDPMPTGSLPDGAQEKASDKGYEINFENTPVATVAKAILGDILGIGYTIDPRVQGTVSLSSGRAVPRKDLLFVLENALRMSGVALVRDGARLSPYPNGGGGCSRFGRLGARSICRIWN